MLRRTISLLFWAALLCVPAGTWAVDGPPVASAPGVSWRETVTGMEFVWVPGGCYPMGCGDWSNTCEADEKPVHEVCVGGFWIGKFEVTQGQWAQVMKANPSRFSGCGLDCPVERVSWEDAERFVAALHDLAGLPLRLPTEAEWEYAARSGGRPEWFPGGAMVLDEVAWYSQSGRNHSHPVGELKPNGLGIYDMGGNVGEWCSDWYDPAYYGVSRRDNPTGPASGETRVIRGGAWNDVWRMARTANRWGDQPRMRFDINGLRVVVPETKR